MPQSVGWRIINTVPTMGIGPDGKPAKGQDVTYQLDTGDSGTIFVPDAQFNANQVGQLVTAHATNLVAVKGLSGQVQGM
jgi:hypothetical protein